MSDAGRSPEAAVRRTATLAVLLAAGMLALGFAAVPLYRLFCQVTGFGGTTMRVNEAQAATILAGDRTAAGKTITIRFDANQRSDLPWKFAPEKPSQMVAAGNRSLGIYLASNLSDQPVTGTATYNVEPAQAGKYFSKIQCFCFTEQTLAPGQQVRMPVIFFVDPKIATDPDTRDIDTITLSYTFYPVDPEKKAG